VTTQESEVQTDSFATRARAIVDNVERVIQGKRDVIEMMLLCLMAEGHLLIEDVPGVGKTSLAKSLARSIDIPFGRIQFTPDLLPSDVVGVNVWNRSDSTFEFRRGPIFNGIVLGDEINRASPKTQSALLESMAEEQVTVDGTTYRLNRPFMVIATQNPIEYEGTYPLPESQLDRFLMRISVGYPSADGELQVLTTHGQGSTLDTLQPVVSADDVAAMVATVGAVHVSPEVSRYLVDLAEATRRHPSLALGMSPRATLAWQRAARANAALSGRSFVQPDDVKALAHSVLGHRLLLTPEAELQGRSTSDAVDDVLRTVPTPSWVARRA
jgi:MoxR-like ATPase